MSIYGYVYKITNLITGKIYIGQKKGCPSMSQNYYGSGVYIKKAINKYGLEQFRKEVVELVEDHGEGRQSVLDDLERHYIKINNATKRTVGYNVSDGGTGGGSSGENHYLYGRRFPEESKRKMIDSKRGKTHTEYTKDKMSRTHKERYALNGHHNKGRKQTKEWVEMMVAINTGSRRSTESKKNIRASSIQRAIKEHGFVHTPYGTFETQQEAAEIAGVSKATIRNRIDSQSDKFAEYFFTQQEG